MANALLFAQHYCMTLAKCPSILNAVVFVLQNLMKAMELIFIIWTLWLFWKISWNWIQDNYSYIPRNLLIYLCTIKARARSGPCTVILIQIMQALSCTHTNDSYICKICLAGRRIYGYVYKRVKLFQVYTDSIQWVL